MPIRLNFTIKNWKLTILALILIGLFSSLGYWQLSRAHEKQRLMDSFTKRLLQAPFSAEALTTLKDWRFYRVKLRGTFDNAHTFLLDNKTVGGRIGYEVYTPFQVQGVNFALLIDRGFIPGGSDRNTLPLIPPIPGPTTLIGMLNLPPLYIALSNIQDTPISHWPLRVEFINLATMGSILNTQFFPYVVIMDPQDPRAFNTKWTVNLIPPERHLAYALQWFALALTLLILFVALNHTK